MCDRLIRVAPGRSSLSVTAETIGIMIGMANRAARHPSIIEISNMLKQGCYSISDYGRRVWLYTRAHIRYQPEDDEQLFDPVLVLGGQIPFGDCDDFAMADASLLKAAGVKCWFITDKAHPVNKNQYTHVYVGLEDEYGRMFICDSSQGPVYGVPGTIGQSHGVTLWEV